MDWFRVRLIRIAQLGERDLEDRSGLTGLPLVTLVGKGQHKARSLVKNQRSSPLADHKPKLEFQVLGSLVHQFSLKELTKQRKLFLVLRSPSQKKLSKLSRIRIICKLTKSSNLTHGNLWRNRSQRRVKRTRKFPKSILPPRVGVLNTQRPKRGLFKGIKLSRRVEARTVGRKISCLMRWPQVKLHTLPIMNLNLELFFGMKRKKIASRTFTIVWMGY